MGVVGAGFSLVLGLLFCGLSVPAAQAQTSAFPSRTVRLILPFAPGGSTDNMARLIALKLTEKWGQSVFVDNKPGGTSTIGSLEMVRSAPDGYTLLFVNNDFVVNPTLKKDLPYDTLKDFAAVATLARSHYMLAINPSLPASNLQEFIALAKAKPGQMNAAAVGTGSVQHLVNELFASEAGIHIAHVSYKGLADGMKDLLTNRVQLTFSNPMGLAELVKAGKLKALAISGDKRSPVLPDVPTFAEASLPKFSGTNWFGIVVPAKIPREIIRKISDDVIQIEQTRDYQERLTKQGVEPFILTPEQFSTLIREDIARYAEVIRKANIKID